MKRMNLFVIMALGVTGMLYAAGGPAPLADEQAAAVPDLRGYYLYKVFPEVGLTPASFPKIDFDSLRAALSKRGLTTEEDYAMAVYQEALKSITHNNPMRALAALWEILSVPSMVAAAKNVEILDRVQNRFDDILTKYPGPAQK